MRPTPADGIVQQAVRTLKREASPALRLFATSASANTPITAIAASIGDGEVDNDADLELLARTTLSHAEAGADIVAPSDMMDGRVGADSRGTRRSRLQRSPILAYAAKYASAFYGPFREAADQRPQFGDRRGYQMDPANVREALREIELDIAEGADMVMVKPALPYLDISPAPRSSFDVPVAAYNVSGEYAMVKAAGERLAGRTARDSSKILTGNQARRSRYHLDVSCQRGFPLAQRLTQAADQVPDWARPVEAIAFDCFGTLADFVDSHFIDAFEEISGAHSIGVEGKQLWDRWLEEGRRLWEERGKGLHEATGGARAEFRLSRRLGHAIRALVSLIWRRCYRHGSLPARLLDRLAAAACFPEVQRCWRRCVEPTVSRSCPTPTTISCHRSFNAKDCSSRPSFLRRPRAPISLARPYSAASASGSSWIRHKCSTSATARLPISLALVQQDLQPPG